MTGAGFSAVSVPSMIINNNVIKNSFQHSITSITSPVGVQHTSILNLFTKYFPLQSSNLCRENSAFDLVRELSSLQDLLLGIKLNRNYIIR